MRILQIHCRYRYQGGEESVAAAEVAMLRDLGVEVETFQVENPDSSAQAARSLALSVWNRQSRRAVEDEIRRTEPDLIQIHNTWFTLSHSVFGAGHALGVPTVAAFHNYRQSCINSLFLRDGVVCDDCRGHTPWRGVTRRCYRDSLVQSGLAGLTLAVHQKRRTLSRELDAALVATDFAAQILIDAGVDPDLVVVLPYGVDDPGPRRRPVTDADTVLYVGRLSEEKGPELLIRAWMAAPPPGLRLEIIGAGPQDDQLRALAATEPGITFAGRVPHHEVAQRLLDARAVAIPSLCFEGQPLSLLEALAAGLPPILADQPPLRGTLAGTASGVLVPPGDQAAWTEALSVLGDDAWLGQASTEARRLFETTFDRQILGGQLVELYRRVITDFTA